MTGVVEFGDFAICPVASPCLQTRHLSSFIVLPTAASKKLEAAGSEDDG